MQYTVQIQPSFRSFEVENHETILEASIRNSSGLPYSCRDGSCGTCKVLLKSGELKIGDFSETALTEQEQAEGYVLCCRSYPSSDIVIESDAVVSEGMPPIIKMPVRVSEITKPAEDVAVVRFEIPKTKTFQFLPGQFVELTLKNGITRCYSMANGVDESFLEFHIRHVPNGQFTTNVFNEMKPKDVLKLQGPLGSFFLREDTEKPIIFLASGTGMAPIASIIKHMQKHKIDRPTSIYWGCRSQKDLYLDHWLQVLAKDRANLNYFPVLSEPDDSWKGKKGFVHEAVLSDCSDLSDFQVYACGAPPMIEAAKRDFLAKRNLPQNEFYADAFVAQ